MKIENQGLNPTDCSKPKTARPVENDPRGAGQRVHLPHLDRKDEAALSEVARLMSKARLALDETPEVRTERIAALQEQVQNDMYEVPIEALARQLASRLK